MLIHRQNVAQAAIERPLLIDCSAARRLVDELHHVDAYPDDMRVGAGEQRELFLGWLSAVEQGRPQIAHYIEKIRTGGSEKRLCASHGFLYVDIVARCFGGLDALTHRVAPGRFARRALDHRVDRAASDTERRCGNLRCEHERECVKRPGPLGQRRVLEAESVLFLDKLVAYQDVIATRATEPRRVPGVQDLALRQAQKTLPGFRHSVGVDPRGAVFDDDAAQPEPFAVMAPADKREAPADAVASRPPLGRPSRRGGDAGGYQKSAIHRVGDALIEEGCDVAAVAADHRAPPDRTVGHSECLDYAELRQRVKLRTTPGTRHRHTEYAGLLHRRGDVRRDAAVPLDLVARRPDLLGELDGSMQDGRVACDRFTCAGRFERPRLLRRDDSDL